MVYSYYVLYKYHTKVFKSGKYMVVCRTGEGLVAANIDYTDLMFLDEAFNRFYHEDRINIP